MMNDLLLYVKVSSSSLAKLQSLNKKHGSKLLFPAALCEQFIMWQAVLVLMLFCQHTISQSIAYIGDSDEFVDPLLALVERKPTHKKTGMQN